MLLGVSDELVMKEYLLTNDELLPAEQPAIDRFQAMGGDPAVILPVVGSRTRVSRGSAGRDAHRYGTIEGYFSEALGIDEAAQRKLRDTFTEAA